MPDPIGRLSEQLGDQSIIAVDAEAELTLLPGSSWLNIQVVLGNFV